MQPLAVFKWLLQYRATRHHAQMCQSKTQAQILWWKQQSCPTVVGQRTHQAPERHYLWLLRWVVCQVLTRSPSVLVWMIQSAPQAQMPSRTPFAHLAMNQSCTRLDLSKHNITINTAKHMQRTNNIEWETWKFCGLGPGTLSQKRK